MRQEARAVKGERQEARGKIATKGTEGTKGVQLAIASSKVSDACRSSPVLPLTYLEELWTTKRTGAIVGCAW